MMSTKKLLLLMFIINLFFIGIGVLIGHPPEQYFAKEASYITWVSFFQLLIISNLAWQTFKLKNTDSAFLWAIIAVGFLFLSIDEVIRIHENLDHIIHRTFHLKETAISDRLDDAIVGVYGLIGLWVLYVYRMELKKYKKVLPLIIIGFICVFSMVFSEMIVNRNDVLPFLISDHTLVKSLYSLFKVLEETFKLLAEGVLLSAFYYCFKTTKQLAHDFKENS